MIGSSPPLQMGQEVWGLLSRSSGATSQRRYSMSDVSGARSIKAVFNRPERTNPCKAALRAASVPRRITCETRTSFRRRELFFTWP